MTTETIARLNDLARRSMGVLCHVHLARSLRSLPPEDQSAIIKKVETFDAFTPANDQDGERGYGAFEYAGRRMFWKIDYYDWTWIRRSSDPANPRKTRRVLVIMPSEDL